MLNENARFYLCLVLPLINYVSLNARKSQASRNEWAKLP
jgi:hypothetical protein